MKNFNIDTDTTAAGATDIGLRRSNNEDAFIIDERIGLIALADGVGGRDVGEVASSEAISALRNYLIECRENGTAKNRRGETFKLQTEGTGGHNSASFIFDQTTAAVFHANEKIYALNRDHGILPDRSMGTTLTGIVCIPDDPWSVVAFNVGDSRLYRLRDGQLVQLSRDDTLHQDWLDGGCVGEEPKRHILSQCIGVQLHVKPSIFTPAFRRDDLLLVCSDGLSDLVGEPELLDHMLKTDRKQLAITCQELIEAANHYGGTDNITVVLVCRQ